MNRLFGRIADRVAHLTGSWQAFSLAAAVVLVWALSGPLFGFSANWQLVINTGTTIITFLMVFLIQHAQNKDGKAVQLKLDGLVEATRAHNKYIGVERKSEDEISAEEDALLKEVERAPGRTRAAAETGAKKGAEDGVKQGLRDAVAEPAPPKRRVRKKGGAAGSPPGSDRPSGTGKG